MGLNQSKSRALQINRKLDKWYVIKSNFPVFLISWGSKQIKRYFKHRGKYEFKLRLSPINDKTGLSIFDSSTPRPLLVLIDPGSINILPRYYYNCRLNGRASVQIAYENPINYTIRRLNRKFMFSFRKKSGIIGKNWIWGQTSQFL